MMPSASIVPCCFRNICSKIFAHVSKRHSLFNVKILKKRLFMTGMFVSLFGAFPLVYAVPNLSSDASIPNIIHFIMKNDAKNVENLLLKHGINVNSKCYGGWNFIHVAVVSQNKDVVKLLLQMGADPNSVDEYSGTKRLSTRINQSPRSIIEERLTYFTNILNPYADYTGFTPLHYAAFLNNEEIIKILIDNGADPKKASLNNETALDLCLVEETKKIIINAINKYQNEMIKQKISSESLELVLESNLIGQKSAIKAVSDAVLRKISGWCLHEGPLVLLFLGSSGVGKTETAKLVAKYVSEKDKENFIRLDMSEYQEKHQVSRMIGSPPGYIGYDDGGQLTKMLKKNPNSIVLLDEIEKAHPDVLTILLQLFDEGRITDSKGETVDASSSIFIMTSNLGSEAIREHATMLRAGQQENSINEHLLLSQNFKNNVIYPILKKYFKRDEFLGRINEIIYFVPFSRCELKQLAALQLQRASEQIRKKHNIALTYSEDVLDFIIEGFNPIYGARSIQNQVEISILNRLAAMYVNGKLDNVQNVTIGVDKTINANPITINVHYSDTESAETGIMSKITSVFS